MISIFKNGTVVIFEILLMLFSSIMLSIFNLHIVWNLIVYILILLEMILVIKKTYNEYIGENEKMIKISRVILILCLVSMVICKSIMKIPSPLITAYVFLMGYLFCNICLLNSKKEIYKSYALAAKYGGIIIFALSVLMGFLALFGIAM